MNAYFGRKNIYTENKNVYSTGKNWINIFLDQIMLLYFFHIWIGNTNQEQKQFWIYLEFLVLIVTLLLFFFPVVTFGVRVLPKYYGKNKGEKGDKKKRKTWGEAKRGKRAKGKKKPMPFVRPGCFAVNC